MNRAFALINFTSPGLVDIDRDGTDEFIIGATGDVNGVWALNGEGRADWDPGISLGVGALSVPASADLDGDDDVDQSDFGLLQRCLSGDGNPADPSCAN